MAVPATFSLRLSTKGGQFDFDPILFGRATMDAAAAEGTVPAESSSLLPPVEDDAARQRRKLDRARLLEWLANQGPCLIGMEACAGAHHLARQLAAQGHEVRLMPGQYVKPFVKTHKNDLTDAEAIAEAVQRPQMRFVPIKTPAQLDVQALHRARDRLVGMRTALVNQIRSEAAPPILLERGLAVGRGRRTLEKALPGLLEDHAVELGAMLVGLIECLRAQWRAVDQPIAALDEQILGLARQDATSQRLMAIIASGNDPVPQGIDRLSRRSIGPGVGPMLATALVAAVGSGAAGFQNGRSLAAWLGLIPRQHSSGGKARLLGVARYGNRYLRRLLVHAARSSSGWHPAATTGWAIGCRGWRPGRTPTSPRSPWPPSSPASVGRSWPATTTTAYPPEATGPAAHTSSARQGRTWPPPSSGVARACRTNRPSRPPELPGPRRADPIAARGMNASSPKAGYIHADATWPHQPSLAETERTIHSVVQNPGCARCGPGSLVPKASRCPAWLGFARALGERMWQVQAPRRGRLSRTESLAACHRTAVKSRPAAMGRHAFACRRWRAVS
ncbi:MAG: IS110 family transposase [Geminicoccaceae bacterium]